MIAKIVNTSYKWRKFVLGYDLNRSDSAKSLNAVKGYAFTNHIRAGYVDINFAAYFDRSFTEQYKQINMFRCFRRDNNLAQNNFRAGA